MSVSGSLNEAGGATVLVGAGDQLTFRGGGDVIAGTLGGAGTVTFVNVNDVLTGARLSAATVAIKDSTVTLKGTITESGVLSVTTSTLVIGAGGVTFSGGGRVALSNNGANRITGLSPGDTLTNLDTTISGAGSLGAGQMKLTNGQRGTINGTGSRSLIIDTGGNQITNAGLIESTGSGGLAIQSAVLNSGRLEVVRGVLTVNGAVTGGGSAVIAGGTLDFTSSFSQNVTFTGATGILELFQSQTYKGAITGFSHAGGTSLDLADIAFVSSNEATFIDNGSKTGGVLTVTDGVHTAKITLVGDYSTATFIAASDGHGGVTIHDPTKPPAPAPNQLAPRPPWIGPDAGHRFIAAMAGFGGDGHGPVLVLSDAHYAHPAMLSAPKMAMA